LDRSKKSGDFLKALGVVYNDFNAFFSKLFTLHFVLVVDFPKGIRVIAEFNEVGHSELLLQAEFFLQNLYFCLVGLRKG